MSALLGPSVNAVAIIVCALVGCFLMRGIPAKFEDIFKKAIGLSVILIGIKGALDCQRMLLCIISMVLGSALGELIGIDAFMNRVGQWAESRLGKNSSGEGNSFAKVFVSTTILYCGGSMATVGSLQSGLLGNHEILFAKSVLDGTTSIIFGATMGIGVMFAAIPVFIYQSGIALLSILVKDFLTPDIIREMSAVGNLIVAGIGFNFLEVKEIKVANFIPAIFIPVVYMIIEARILHFF
jgi:uncharacterized membrane protein YqgA involved in biofilm formation